MIFPIASYTPKLSNIYEYYTTENYPDVYSNLTFDQAIVDDYYNDVDYGFLYDDEDYDYVIKPKPKTKKPTFWSLFKAKNPPKGRYSLLFFNASPKKCGSNL